MLGQLRRIGESELAGQNLVLAAMVIVGVFFLGIVVITPLDLVSQALFAVLTVLAMLLVRGQPSRGVTLILDFVGAPYWNDNLDALGMGGRLMLIGHMGGSASGDLKIGAIMGKKLTITGTTLRGTPLPQ